MLVIGLFLGKSPAWADNASKKGYDFVTLHNLKHPNAFLCKLVIEEAFQRNGLKTTFQTVPAKRALEMVEIGEADGDLMRVDKLKHKNYLRIEEPIYHASWAVYTLRKKISFKTWNDLKTGNYIVGHHDGSLRPKHMIENVLKIDKKKRVLFTANFMNGFKMLMEDRFDVLVIGSVNAIILLKEKNFLNEGVRFAGTVEKFYLHSFLSVRHADLEPKISKTIREMKADGTFRRLQDISGFDF